MVEILCFENVSWGGKKCGIDGESQEEKYDPDVQMFMRKNSLVRCFIGEKYLHNFSYFGFFVPGHRGAFAASECVRSLCRSMMCLHSPRLANCGGSFCLSLFIFNFDLASAKTGEQFRNDASELCDYFLCVEARDKLLNRD